MGASKEWVPGWKLAMEIMEALDIPADLDVTKLEIEAPCNGAAMVKLTCLVDRSKVTKIRQAVKEFRLVKAEYAAVSDMVREANKEAR